jgi:hypothetical protein
MRFTIFFLMFVFQNVKDYTDQQQWNSMTQSVSLGNGDNDVHVWFLIDSDIDFMELTIELNNSTLIIPQNRFLFIDGVNITKDEAIEIGCFKKIGENNFIDY